MAVVTGSITGLATFAAFLPPLTLLSFLSDYFQIKATWANTAILQKIISVQWSLFFLKETKLLLNYPTKKMLFLNLGISFSIMGGVIMVVCLKQHGLENGSKIWHTCWHEFNHVNLTEIKIWLCLLPSRTYRLPSLPLLTLTDFVSYRLLTFPYKK